VSASGAPAGICDASDVLDEKAGAARDRIGLSYGWTSTVLFFNDLRSATERHAAMASYEHPMKGHWTLEIGAGSLLAGFLDTPTGKATFAPGVLADVSLSHLVIAPSGYARPFFLWSFSLAGVWSRTTIAETSATADYTAFDFSATAAAGISMRVGKHSLTPFLAGRVYGGPAFWTYLGKPELGSDAYHYSLGPGFALSFFHSRIGVSFGASLLGEKSAKAGFSVAF
jgi:hypothetical protein